MPSNPPPFIYSAHKAYRVIEYSFPVIAGSGVRSVGATPATGLLAGGSATQGPTGLAIDTGVGANKIWEWSEYVHNFYQALPDEANGGGAFWTNGGEVSVSIQGTATNPAGDCVAGIELGSSKLAPPFATNMPLQGLGTIQARFNYATGNWELLIYDDGAVDIAVETCTTQPNDLDGNRRFLKLIYRPGLAQVIVDNILIHTSTNARLAAIGTGSGPDQGAGIFFASGSNAAGRVQGNFAQLRHTWYQPGR